MKHLTVVEWLIEELKGYEYDGNDFIFNGVITSELIEEAREMEKQQIIEAHLGVDYSTEGNVNSAKKYYDDKYQNK